MLSDVQISRNTESLFAATHYVGAQEGGMVIYTLAPICVFTGLEKILNKQILLVRFIHDKNWPKLAIDDLDRIDFHTEFSVAWQCFRFQPRNKLLLVQGKSKQFPMGYKIHIHLRDKKVSRDA